MIAQGLERTRRIKLGSGVHLLPYHPAEVAQRVDYLDHISQVRFMFSIGSSGLPSDRAFFNVGGNNGRHREVTLESLDIILKIWENQRPLKYRGKFPVGTEKIWKDAAWGIGVSHMVRGGVVARAVDQ